MAKEKKISFKAVVEFEGSIEEFQRLMNDLGTGRKGNLTARWIGKDIVDIDIKGTQGIVPDPEGRLNKSELDSLIQGMPHITMSGDIRGGIRDPHIHVADGVAILDKAKFKEYVGIVADRLSRELAEEVGYVETAEAICHLSRKINR